VTAADALRRLLADVEHVRNCFDPACRLPQCTNSFDYLERLALDGLAGEAAAVRSPSLPWTRIVGESWTCTHVNCFSPAPYGIRSEQSTGPDEGEGACEKHAAEMGVFKPTEDGQS